LNCGAAGDVVVLVDERAEHGERLSAASVAVA
jgi:hypothetical protein